MTTIKKLQRLIDGSDSSVIWTALIPENQNTSPTYFHHCFYACPNDKTVEIEISQIQGKIHRAVNYNEMGPIWIVIVPSSIASLVDSDPYSWGLFSTWWDHRFSQFLETAAIVKYVTTTDGSEFVCYPSIGGLAPLLSFTDPQPIVPKFKMQPGDRLYAFVKTEVQWGTTQYNTLYEPFDNYFTFNAIVYEEAHAGEVDRTLLNRILLGWGDNSTFQLGVTSPSTTSSPIYIGSLIDWKSIAKGEQNGTTKYASTFGVRNDGTLWSWGYNNIGQLGNGYTTNKSAPTQIATQTQFEDMGWIDVVTSPNGDHAFGLAVDSRLKKTHLYGWGKNDNGILGVGDTVNRSIPTRVQNELDWRLISTGESITYGIDSNNRLFGWGHNTDGQLGHPPFATSIVAPTPLSTDWKTISTNGHYTLGIKTDGTLWSWGQDSDGQLGLGFSGGNRITVPTRIGAQSNWAFCLAGGQSTTYFGMASFAIKGDGTLWAWGRNNFGQLGLGDTTDRSVPVQVGAENNWSKVFYLSNNTFAVKTDGTLWAWGENQSGSLGLEDTNSRSTPTLVGKIDDAWKVIAPGISTHAIKAA